MKNINIAALEFGFLALAVALWFAINTRGTNFYSAALCGWLYIALHEHRPIRQWFCVILISLPFALIYGIAVFLPVIGAVWGGLLCYRSVQHPDKEKNSVPFFVLVALLVFALRQQLVIAHTWNTMDTTLLALDKRFFFDMSERIWKASAHYPIEALILATVYACLPLAAVIVLYHCPKWSCIALGGCMLTAAFLAVPVYLLIPAVGLSHLEDVSAPRNCMPSLHVTWALLLWLKRDATPRILRPVLDVFVVLTVISTLTTGEHYFVDIVAAVRFTALTILVWQLFQQKLNMRLLSLTRS